MAKLADDLEDMLTDASFGGECLEWSCGALAIGKCGFCELPVCVAHLTAYNDTECCEDCRDDRERADDATAERQREQGRD